MGPAHPTMSSEQTTALICFSSRNPASGSHGQLCLGTEGNGPDDAPYAFTITVAKGVGGGASQPTSNLNERIPLSRADLEKLRGWINLVAPAG